MRRLSKIPPASLLPVGARPGAAHSAGLGMAGLAWPASHSRKMLEACYWHSM